LRLELGPGIHRQPEVDIAIDKCPDADCDIVRDFAKRGIPFSDDLFDDVLAYDVLEHIESYDDLIFLVNEVWRVLRSGGIFHVTVPNYLCGFDHPTHHRVFSSGAFYYFQNNDNPEMQYMRKSDGIICNFDIEFIPCDDESILRVQLTCRKESSG